MVSRLALAVRALSVYSVATAVAPANAATALDARDASNSSWAQYVRSPSSSTVIPVGIVAGSVTGNVSDPGALLGVDASHVTVLSRLSSADAVACLTIDFGQVHAGQLHINFAGAQKAPGSDAAAGHGHPSLQLAFSETMEYLTDQSDFTRSFNAPDDTSDHVVFDGVDQIAVKLDPYTWIDQQGYFLNKYFNTVVLALDRFYPNHTDAETSLLSKDPKFGDYAFLPRNGSVTYYNALYVLALQRGADLADYLSQDSLSSTWRQRAGTVARSLLQRNWDSSVGAFFDGSPCSGSALCPTHSQDGNSLAILSGVTASHAGNSSSNGTTAAAESILTFLSSAMRRPYGNAFFDNDRLGSFSQRVYPFLAYFELAARFATSRATAPSAYEELRRLYGWMSAHEPGVTFWEGIDAGGAPFEQGFTSMAHGWSAGVTPLLTGFVLGVKPTAPGFGTWAVKPVVDGSGLSWARGQVPTPAGPLSVSWQIGSGNASFRIQVDVPQGTNGTVSVPVDDTTTSVTLDGTEVLVATSDGYVTVPCGAGTHVVEVGSSEIAVDLK
ncbi:hypothetical protein P8C59_000638 [Phyllachora maydis]|uniref:Alpha-L-rhamnosidase C-terminal domain-containing protein n=1 Tax=Phyllachora maydis TaxID=1825666 RepID=A0AAD9M7W5_9PEZI|nr:hypothetical protein P8C59_000638 [Phyllachora maydis]